METVAGGAALATMAAVVSAVVWCALMKKSPEMVWRILSNHRGAVSGVSVIWRDLFVQDVEGSSVEGCRAADGVQTNPVQRAAQCDAATTQGHASVAGHGQCSAGHPSVAGHSEQRDGTGVSLGCRQGCRQQNAGR